MAETVDFDMTGVRPVEGERIDFEMDGVRPVRKVGFIESALRTAGEAARSAVGMFDLAAAGLAGLVSGQDESDRVLGMYEERQRGLREAYAQKPDEEFSTAGQLAGGFASMPIELTGGFGIQHGIERAGEVIERGGTMGQAAKAGGVTGGVRAALNFLPVKAGGAVGRAIESRIGGVIGGAATGGAISGAGGVAGRAAENAALPDGEQYADLEQPVLDEGAVATDVGMGAAFGAIPGAAGAVRAVRKGKTPPVAEQSFEQAAKAHGFENVGPGEDVHGVENPPDYYTTPSGAYITAEQWDNASPRLRESWTKPQERAADVPDDAGPAAEEIDAAPPVDARAEELARLREQATTDEAKRVLDELTKEHAKKRETEDAAIAAEQSRAELERLASETTDHELAAALQERARKLAEQTKGRRVEDAEPTVEEIKAAPEEALPPGDGARTDPLAERGQADDPVIPRQEVNDPRAVDRVEPEQPGDVATRAGEGGADLPRPVIPRAEAEKRLQAAGMSREDAKIALGFRETVPPHAMDAALEKHRGRQDKATVADLERRLRAEGADVTLRHVPDAEAYAGPEVAGRKLAGDVAQRFGKRVLWVDQGERPLFNGAVPFDSADVIVLAKNSTRPASAVTGHELTHWMRRDRPQLYADLVADLGPHLGEYDRFAGELNGRRQKRGLPPLSKDKLQEEFIADVVGNRFAEPAFWAEMAQRDPGRFERVARAAIEWITQAIERLKGGRKGDVDAYVRDLQQARKVIAEALKKYADGDSGAANPDRNANPRYTRDQIKNADPDEITRIAGENDGVIPAFLPAPDHYMPQAAEAVRKTGEFQFKEEDAAQRYARALELGEGGKWAAQKVGGHWRAVRQDALSLSDDHGFAETERIYGGREAYGRAKADGRTKLSYGQWVQVRTPNFKRWFGDWEAGAKLRSIHDAAKTLIDGADDAVARGLRPDLAVYGGSSDVVIPWGDSKFGLGKIVSRRGAQVAADVLRTVALGKVERHVEAKKTVLLSYGDARAVLSLDEHGKQKTWLLTGWEEGKPDATGEVRTQSGATQRTPTFGRDALGAGLENILRANDPVSKAVDPETGEPLVVYHGTALYPWEARSRFDKGSRGRFTKEDPGAQYGFFFAESYADAIYYSDRAVSRSEEKPSPTEPSDLVAPKGDVIDVYLKSENPLVLDAENSSSLPSSIYDEIIDDNKAALIYAERSGYDALHIKDGDSVNTPGTWVVFRSEQIKSATGNRGTFDPHDSNILLDLTAGGERAKLAVETAAEYYTRKWLDRFNRVAKAQKAVEDAKGGAELADRENIYQADTLYHGRVQHAGDQLEKLYFNPLAKKLKGASDIGLTVKDADEYLMALHAPERNRVIAARNPKMPDGGSGLTNAQAREIIGSYTPEQKAVLDDIAKFVQRMNADKLKRMLDGGLITRETFDRLRTQYKHYVPLKTLDEEDAARGIGRGYEMRANDIRTAMGRSTRAGSPIAATMMDFARTVIRTEKARVDRTIWNFAQNEQAHSFMRPYDQGNPPKEVMKREIGPDGKVREVVDPIAVQDKTISLVVDGENKRVFVADDLLRDQLRKLSATQDIGAALTAIGKATGTVGRMMTEFNPSFTLPNAVRDAGAAYIRARAYEGVNPNAVVKNIPTGWRAIVEHKRGVDSADAKLYEEFLGHGGKTGAYGITGVLDTMHKLEKAGAEIGYDGQSRGLGTKAWNVLGDVADVVSGANEVFEYATRFALYKEARRAGYSADKAAAMAKEITVNFNRSGEYGRAMNSVFVFANAALQGLNGTIKFAKDKKVRNAMLAMVALGAGVQAFNEMLGGENEETGELNANVLNDSVQDKNIQILFGGPSGLKIPIDPSYSFLYAMGRRLWRAASQGDIGREAAGITGALIDATLPLRLSDADSVPEKLLSAITPTVVAPFFDISRNKNFFGQAIVPEHHGKVPAPAYTVSSPQTSAVARAVSELLNTVTGGDAVEPGLAQKTLGDFASPEAIEYLVGYYTGGLGQAAMQSKNAISSVSGGKPVDVNKLPVVNRFYFDDPQSYVSRRYRELSDSFEYAKNREKRNLAVDRIDPQVRSALPSYNMAESRLKELYKQMREAAGREEDLDPYREQIRAVKAGVIKRYNEARQ